MTRDVAPAGREARRVPAGWALVAVLAAVLVVRFAFGVTSEFWGEDERQIYLIGLRAYTTHTWPDFGPDVVYTQTQVPGALQGLLIAGPMRIVAQPEAPYVLLNVLTFAALLLLGWYIERRVTGLPRWALWGWLFFSPWTLEISTHVYNPDYVLPGAVLFWMGAFESVPALRVGAMARPLAAACMGFGLLWIGQLHMSVYLLLPVTAAVFATVLRARPRTFAAEMVAFAAGAILAGLTLVPTILHVGFAGVLGRAGANIVFEPTNLLRLPQVAAQYFSFASFEIARFLGSNTPDRLAFLGRFWWAAPFVVVAGAMGVLQAVVLAAGLFWSRGMAPGWTGVRAAAAALLLLVYASFVWSVRTPTSHTFYVVLPPVLIYACYCWDRLFTRRAVRVAAAVLLVCGAVTQVAIAARNFHDRSLYTNRALVVRAIQEKNDRLVGERRTDAWPARP